MYSFNRTLQCGIKKKIEDSQKIKGSAIHEMCARIFFYTGLVPDEWDDDKIVTAHARIMFCLVERNEGKLE